MTESDFKEALIRGIVWTVPKWPGTLVYYKEKWYLAKGRGQFIIPSTETVIALLGLDLYLEFLFEQKYGN